MRAAICVLVIVVAFLSLGPGRPAFADEPERILGMALAEAQHGHCTEALAHLDQYLTATAKPSADAFEVMRRCPRQGVPAAEPTSAPVAHKARGRWFLVDVELGLNVPVTSALNTSSGSVRTRR